MRTLDKKALEEKAADLGLAFGEASFAPTGIPTNPPWEPIVEFMKRSPLLSLLLMDTNCYGTFSAEDAPPVFVPALCPVSRARR